MTNIFLLILENPFKNKTIEFNYFGFLHQPIEDLIHFEKLIWKSVWMLGAFKEFLYNLTPYTLILHHFDLKNNLQS